MTSRRRKSAFGLFELLLSLIIMVMLLAAVAVAINASLKSYHENDNVASVSQSARAVLGRMMLDVRTAAAVALSDPPTRLTIIRPDDSSEQDRRIQYEFLNGLLYYRQTVNGLTTVNDIILGSANDVGVAGFNVGIVQGLNWQGYTCAKSVTVTLDLEQDHQRYSMTVSASPRRSQTY